MSSYPWYIATYGLTRSNSDWEDHADERLLLRQARDIERPMFTKKTHVGMGRFVDEFFCFFSRTCCSRAEGGLGNGHLDESKSAGHKPVLPHAWAASISQARLNPSADL